ncbi:MAG: hypothetical protein EBQ87_13265 [Planctomycetes bacterium]|nr:hypothetical protein [Planctomycetota bacterium]
MRHLLIHVDLLKTHSYYFMRTKKLNLLEATLIKNQNEVKRFATIDINFFIKITLIKTSFLLYIPKVCVQMSACSQIG